MSGLAVSAVWPSSLQVSPLMKAAGPRHVVVMARAALGGEKPPPTTDSVPFGPDRGSTQTTVVAVTGKGADLAAFADEGAGHVLAIAVDPLRNGRVGYELLPALGPLVLHATATPAGPARTGAEVYLDPGGLHGALKGSPDRLAAYLADARVVHLAGWNFSGGSPSYNYDYGALIAALHRRGILVYAWLEPPFVNQALWDLHPECREKTATGRDAFVDWRHLMALEDAHCMQLAWGEWTDLLTRYDWDGVNVAELYFQPATSAADATPFHPSALAQFGKDPKADAAGFLQFRTNLVTQLNEEMLRRLNGLPRAGQLDFELTVIDNHLDPSLATAVGSDVDRLADVAKRGGASLQVEDPYTVWAQGPLRYDRLAPAIAPLMPAGDAFVDVNVVDRAAVRPTVAMTGAEEALAFASAAQISGRVAAYSAGTITPADMASLAGALAGAAETFDGGERAPWTVIVHSPRGPTDDRLTVDGVPWPAGAGVSVVPAGEHHLEWSAGPPAGPGLVRLTAELSSARTAPGELVLDYASRPVAFVTTTARPRSLTVDGAPAALDLMSSVPGATVIRLPPGSHRLTLTF